MKAVKNKPKKKPFNLKRLLRQIHYWLSLAIFIPSGIVFTTGILLILKKQITWVQPPTIKGIERNYIPSTTYMDILQAVRLKPEAGIQEWSDISKIDIRPSKGIAKVISKSGWEVQVDTANGSVLSSRYRRSDTIEAIHDGSYFAGWVKLYIFLPTGILLIIMWATGVYLFLIPQIQKTRKKRKKNRS